MMRARIVFAFAMLLSFAVSIRQQGFSVQADYQVYYAAGMVVHQHLGAHLYERPDPKLDPVLRLTSPGTVFARVAASRGIVPVPTYIYPPLLADLMVPISLIPDLPSTLLWRAFNTALIGCCALLLGSYLELSRRLICALFFAIFFFTPVAESIVWGQIGIVLLACWTAGIVLYAGGRHRSSALLLALATAIKLTPLLAFAPLLLWREWRWLRWYTLGLAATVAFVLVCNGPGPLQEYFVRVLPAMSNGVPNLQNKTLPSALQLTVMAHRGADLALTNVSLLDDDSAPPRPSAPAWTVQLAKLACAALLGALLLLVLRLGRRISIVQRAEILAALCAVSVSLSPVAWRHSYCMEVPLLVFAWHRALTRRINGWELALLGLFSVEAGSFLLESIVKRLTHGALLQATPAALPLLSVAFVAYRLLQMHQAQRTSVLFAAPHTGVPR